MTLRARAVDVIFDALELIACAYDLPRRVRRWWRQRRDPKLDTTEPIPLVRRARDLVRFGRTGDDYGGQCPETIPAMPFLATESAGTR